MTYEQDVLDAAGWELLPCSIPRLVKIKFKNVVSVRNYTAFAGYDEEAFNKLYRFYRNNQCLYAEKEKFYHIYNRFEKSSHLLPKFYNTFI